MQTAKSLQKTLSQLRSVAQLAAIGLVLLVPSTLAMNWFAQHSLETRESVNDAVAMHEYMTSATMVYFGTAGIVLGAVVLVVTGIYALRTKLSLRKLLQQGSGLNEEEKVSKKIAR